MHRMIHIGKSFLPLPPECCYSYPTTSNWHKQYQHDAFPVRNPEQQLTQTNVVKTNHQHPPHNGFSISVSSLASTLSYHAQSPLSPWNTCVCLVENERPLITMSDLCDPQYCYFFPIQLFFLILSYLRNCNFVLFCYHFVHFYCTIE